MKLIHWNITSYTNNFEELKLVINENNPDCVCLQETRHGTRSLKAPGGYYAIQSRKVRDNDSERGVALLIKKTINFTPITLVTGQKVEAVAARVWSGQYYTVCSIYLSPNIRYNQSDITQILNQLPQPYLLLGDMNARHPTWGEPTECTNNNGRIFDGLLEDLPIALLNSEEKTHYSIQHGTSALIDLSIVSIGLLTDFTATVAESTHGSDHFPVLLNKPTVTLSDEPSLKFKTEKADWETFREMTNRYPTTEGEIDINRKVDDLTKFILEAAQATIPISMGSKNGKIPVPWFNEECKRVHRERKRAARALERNYTRANILAYKRLNALCRWTFKKSRKEAWEKYVSSINANTSMSQIWKKVKKIEGKFSHHRRPLLKKQDGRLTEEPGETSNIFARTFSSISEGLDYNNDRFKRYKNSQETVEINFSGGISDEYNEKLTMSEFIDALASMKDSSPGHDSITYSMIKNSHPSLQNYILDLYNEIFITGNFPDTWRISTIIPIPKSDKDHSDPLNYRPISLTSCLCKLLERMINRRLVWFLEENQHLNNTQSGFRKARSTTDCLAQLAGDVQQAIIEKNHTIVVFFDLEKAYDLTWKYSILKKLHEFGMRGNLPQFIANFLKNRIIRVRIGTTHSRDMNVEEGVPQGSVLSCTLFAIAIDEVFKYLPRDVRSALYVDDLAIYVTGKRNTSILRKLQLAINKLEAWCDRTGFKFSELKTAAMHVCRKRKCEKKAGPLLLNGKIIKEEESQKYLGLIIDKSLTWNKHIEYLRTDCRRRMNLLKHVGHLSWGADTKTLILMYKAIIKSKIEYGAEIYGSASATLLAKLNALQNEALRVATGAFKSSRIESLEVLTGVMPLRLSRQQKLAKYMLRVWATPTNPVNRLMSNNSSNRYIDSEEPPHLTQFAQRSLTKKFESTSRELKLEQQHLWIEGNTQFPPWKTESLEPCPDLIKNSKGSIPDITLKVIFYSHMVSHKENEYRVYTDGSKTSDGVAFAIMGKPSPRTSITKSRKLDKQCSIFTAELYAILHAIRDGGMRPQTSTLVITDSKSSIQALMQPFTRNPLVQEIQREAHEGTKKIKLCWVPSHIGVQGNEIADKLARETTKDTSIMRSQMLRGDMEAHVKHEVKATWLSGWTTISENVNHLRQITDNLRPLPNSTGEIRSWEVKLARLRLGYTRMTHGYLMSGDLRPICERCIDDAALTVKHILIECPEYRTARIRAFCKSRITLKEALSEGDTTYGGPLYKYICEIGLLNSI